MSTVDNKRRRVRTPARPSSGPIDLVIAMLELWRDPPIRISVARQRGTRRAAEHQASPRATRAR